MTDLDGRVAVVTGAGNGIGRAIAVALAREGAKVMVCDVLGEDGARAVRDIEAAGGVAVLRVADVSVPDEAEQLMQDAVDRLGGLDILVNDAGIGGARRRLDATQIRERAAARQPLGRQAQPAEVVDVAAFLASRRSSFMTGAIVTVDGGCTTTCNYGDASN